MMKTVASVNHSKRVAVWCECDNESDANNTSELAEESLLFRLLEPHVHPARMF